MNRRKFLKTTATAGMAVIASVSSLKAADSKINRKEIERHYGFFDLCCIRPDATNSKFILAKPAESIWPKLEKIHAKANELKSPLLSTTCLGILRSEPKLSVKDTLAKGENYDSAFISINASQEEVKHALACQTIYLERTGYPTPQENVNRHAEDIFLNNPNAAKIVKGLGERHWIVFGRGFQYCGEAAIVGLLALGKRVTVLEDMIIPAGGEWSELKTVEKTKKYLLSLGAEFASSDLFLA
jgi:hypothetical protein